ncbi:MAG TPA: hypothetical protein VHC48_08990, partial [Puia sp.]|nr:hypothetical protein [Puia sp.]
MLLYAGIHHELWGDEVHSWNIAKASHSYAQLLANKRYEGHPPAWYTLLWVLSKFTHQVRYIQVMHGLIAAAIAWIILFKAPFAPLTKVLLPFGYYFLYEYGVISRNYALGVLFAFCLCLVLQREFKYKQPLYYLLLFCLSNVHLLALLLAAGIHLYFLLDIRRGKTTFQLTEHALLGAAVLLPAAWFIHLPPGSEVDPYAWVHSWNVRQLTGFYVPMLRAFLPVPAWWNYHFWNTEFLFASGDSLSILRIVFGWSLLAGCILMLRKDRECMALFAANIILSYILSVTVFQLNTARHCGFIYIGFIVAWWLYCHRHPTVNSPWPDALLIVQLIAGVFAVFWDIRHPFSNTGKVEELIVQVPRDRQLVSDYWTMNAVEAFTDTPIYCVDAQREMSLVLFDSSLARVDNNPHRYTDGFRQLF